MSLELARRATWRTRAASALIALVLSGVGVLALAGPAAAAPSDCPSGYTCSYSGYNYTNDAWQQPSTHKFANCVDVMAIGWRSYGNVISSTFNNGRSQNSYLYKGQNQTGGKGLLILRGQGFGNVGSYNDEIESGYFSGTLSSVGSALCR